MDVYGADRSLKGKLRRRYAKLVARRPARLNPGQGMVSFTFDDAPHSAMLDGARILEERGLRGTYFISAGLMGQDGPMGRYGDTDDVRRLAKAGHEIACHTYSHLDCGQADAETIVANIAANTQALKKLGVRTETFAYPYGDVSPVAKRALGSRYSVLRALHHGLVSPGVDLNQAPAVGIESEDGEAVARHWLSQAAQRKAWLILYTHDVAQAPSPFGCTPQVLQRLVDEALNLGLQVVTAAEGARRFGAQSAGV